MSEGDETDLAQRAKAGDEEALDALIRRHQGRVRAFLAARLHDPSLADDLAQDAFVIACARLHTFDPAMPFYPWVRGIAHNVLRHHVRKQHPVNTAPDDLAELLDRAASERVEALGDHDHVGLLRDCLEKLTGTAAQTIRAHYFEAHDLTAIAGAQGRTAKAVGVMLVRTRKWLRECLQSRIQAQREVGA